MKKSAPTAASQDHLEAFGIKPKTIRFNAGTAKRYERAWFEDAWNRYLPELSGTSVTTAQLSQEPAASIRNGSSGSTDGR